MVSEDSRVLKSSREREAKEGEDRTEGGVVVMKDSL